MGANEGQYGQALRDRSGYADRLVSFEPVPEAFQVLARRAEQDPAWLCERVALSDHEGESEINVGPATVLSSMLSPQRSLDGTSLAVRGQRTASVILKTLDAAVRPHLRGGERILLKIDVQGYEAQF